MKIKSQRDFFSGLMFVIVGVMFAVGAMNYRMGPACLAQDPCATGLFARFTQLSARPGAGYFPLGLSVLMVILGAVVLFKSLTIETEGGDLIGAVAWRPLIVIVVAIAVFGATITTLGLLIAVPILIVISSFADDEFKWVGVIINAAVLTVFSWLVFVYGLKLTIPLWPSVVAG